MDAIGGGSKHNPFEQLNAEAKKKGVSISEDGGILMTYKLKGGISIFGKRFGGRITKTLYDISQLPEASKTELKSRVVDAISGGGFERQKYEILRCGNCPKIGSAKYNSMSFSATKTEKQLEIEVKVMTNQIDSSMTVLEEILSKPPRWQRAFIENEQVDDELKIEVFEYAVKKGNKGVVRLFERFLKNLDNSEAIAGLLYDFLPSVKGDLPSMKNKENVKRALGAAFKIVKQAKTPEEGNEHKTDNFTISGHDWDERGQDLDELMVGVHDLSMEGSEKVGALFSEEEDRGTSDESDSSWGCREFDDP
jgi:hypothetical protein